MKKYNNLQINELQEKLYYNCNIHDSIFKSKIYKDGIFTAELFNKYTNKKTFIVFEDVKILLSFKKESAIKISLVDDEILDLEVKDNYDFLQEYLKESKSFFDNSLYLVFYMNSDNELHISSGTVSIETPE